MANTTAVGDSTACATIVSNQNMTVQNITEVCLEEKQYPIEDMQAACVNFAYFMLLIG